MYIVYVAYRRLKGWTNWAEFCCGHSGVAAGVKAKKVEIFFNFYVKTFLFLFPLATPSASSSYFVSILKVYSISIALKG